MIAERVCWVVLMVSNGAMRLYTAHYTLLCIPSLFGGHGFGSFLFFTEDEEEAAPKAHVVKNLEELRLLGFVDIVFWEAY